MKLSKIYVYFTSYPMKITQERRDEIFQNAYDGVITAREKKELSEDIIESLEPNDIDENSSSRP